VVLDDGRRQQGKVRGVSKGTVQLQVGAGSIGIPLAKVAEVRMAAPKALVAARKALDAGDYKKAALAFAKVVALFKGLPTDWARESLALLGDTYLELDQLPQAEQAFADLAAAYPGPEGEALANMGLARLALAKEDYAGVLERLEPVAREALGKPYVSEADSARYGRLFYLLGQAREARGKTAEALEDYLRIVTLFYHDEATAKLAKAKADTLRENNQITVP
jgi:tetratricopeptide (TPR) repeat protein